MYSREFFMPFDEADQFQRTTSIVNLENTTKNWILGNNVTADPFTINNTLLTMTPLYLIIVHCWAEWPVLSSCAFRFYSNEQCSGNSLVDSNQTFVALEDKSLWIKIVPEEVILNSPENRLSCESRLIFGVNGTFPNAVKLQKMVLATVESINSVWPGSILSKSTSFSDSGAAVEVRKDAQIVGMSLTGKADILLRTTVEGTTLSWCRSIQQTCVLAAQRMNVLNMAICCCRWQY